MKTASYFFILLFMGCFSQRKSTGRKLIFRDDFTRLDTSIWIAEIAPLPDSRVYVENGELILDTRGGVTVWLNKKLQGDIMVQYKRKVMMKNGKNDRLSDLNTFWMATDPGNPNLFTRNGILESYDSLKMYYAGMGGNSNSTTRFRKYEGTGARTLLKEYTDSSHLLRANREYEITITMKNGRIEYLVDGEHYFDYTDKEFLKEGYFGFRSTKSRQAINEIRIYQLD